MGEERERRERTAEGGVYVAWTAHAFSSGVARGLASASRVRQPARADEKTSADLATAAKPERERAMDGLGQPTGAIDAKYSSKTGAQSTIS